MSIPEHSIYSRQYLRHSILLLVFIIIAAVLCVRVAKLQILENAYLQRHGEARAVREMEIPAWRGSISDRHGIQLAVSTNIPGIAAVPEKLLGQVDRLSELAETIQLNVSELQQRLHASLQRNRDFMYLRRHVDPAMAEQVAALAIDGVYQTKERKRYYPMAEFTSHVVGFSDLDGHGLEGMELAYNDSLAGKKGRRKVLVNSRRDIVEYLDTIETAVAGKDLQLSIDQRIQYSAWQELHATIQKHRARGGSLVVLDVRTGEVLAMVNQPGYNPNNRDELNAGYARNRAVTDVFEPGSTMKPFTVTYAMLSGEYPPNSRIDTYPGYLRVGEHTIHDLHNYGELDLRSVLIKSSNVAASKIMLSMDIENYVDWLSRMGFGELSGGAFPGEVTGVLPRHYHWSEVERATLSFGYGLSVTALQLARAYAAIANGGKLLPISFLKLSAPPSGEQVIPPQIARRVLHMMEGVVSTEGTAKQAILDFYRAAGKTGTIHKVGSEGYETDRYRSLFVGIVPVSRPRLVMVTMIDEPGTGKYFGGLVAAPVFAAVMKDALRILSVAPDKLIHAETQHILTHKNTNLPVDAVTRPVLPAMVDENVDTNTLPQMR